MASDRSPYVCIADSLLSESWPPHVKLTVVLLSCHMHSRWRSDRRLSLEQVAQEHYLSLGDLLTVTSRTTRARAAGVLAAVTEAVSLTFRWRDAGVIISWPKWAEYNRINSRSPGASQPPPKPKPKPKKKEEEEEEKEPHAARASSVQPDLELTQDSPEGPAWPEIRSAFAAYGRSFHTKPSKEARRLIAARLREGHPAADLVAAVHGRIYLHRHNRGNGFDVLAHHRPEVVFAPASVRGRAGFEAFVAAYADAVAAGLTPPFTAANLEPRALSREELKRISRGEEIE